MRDLIYFPAVQTKTGFIKVILGFEIRDLWVGVYWKRYPKSVDVYACLLPCLPLNIYWQWGMK